MHRGLCTVFPERSSNVDWLVVRQTSRHRYLKVTSPLWRKFLGLLPSLRKRRGTSFVAG